EHRGDAVAERELDRADRYVTPQLAGGGELSDRAGDLRRRGEEERVRDREAADRLPEREAADDRGERYGVVAQKQILRCAQDDNVAQDDSVARDDSVVRKC